MSTRAIGVDDLQFPEMKPRKSADSICLIGGPNAKTRTNKERDFELKHHGFLLESRLHFRIMP
jgi:hypothetical protein